jgi:hypothetical protein
MPSYRLLAGYGTVVEIFDADDDGQAIDYARRLTERWPNYPAIAERGGLRLEREEGHAWQWFFSWVPRGPSSP